MDRSNPLTQPARITASQIAREAGVSAATVSLVLNQRADALRIHPDTQRRVRAAAERLNYVPNYLARGLTGASTRTIGLLWPLGGSPSNKAMAYTLIQRFAERGYLTFMTDVLRNRRFTAQVLAEMAQRRVDALVLSAGGTMLDDPDVGARIGAFDHAVVLGPRSAKVDCDFILHDRRPAMRQIADHFVASARRRPALLTVGNANITKIQGFAERMCEHGVKLGRSYLLNAPYKGDAAMAPSVIGYLDRRFPRRFPFDAVACTDDDVAMVFCHWLRGRGLRIGEDVAVTGFNDALPTAFADPPIASVDRRDMAAAERVEQMLFEQIEGLNDVPRSERLDMRFVWRESAGGDGDLATTLDDAS